MAGNGHHVRRMHIPDHAEPLEPERQRDADRARWRRALNVALVSVLALLAIHAASAAADVRIWTVRPGRPEGLLGVLTAPLLHGSWGHVAANSVALLMLGTLAGAVYPRATSMALPLMWLGSGLGAWLLGDPGGHHLGASGVTHGLMFLLLTLGLVRRDRAAVAAAMISFFLYGGMLLTVLPRELGVSWQSHLGGAIGGAVGAWLLRARDPLPPRRRYSWEDEEEAATTGATDADTFEPPRPREVPVLWHREPPERGVVLPFTRRPRKDSAPPET